MDPAQVMGVGTADLEDTRRRAELLLERGAVVQMFAGHRVAIGQPGNRALVDQLTTVDTRARSEVHHVISDGDDFRLVLHHQHGVALVAQA